jgi:hypothetical protein
MWESSSRQRLFGAPAGRSVFSLPAGPGANVEKDGSSASLTAMSDSPGGCLINVGSQKSPREPEAAGGARTPVNEGEKKKNVETKPQTKNPKLPEILLLWIKYILEMSFLKKFLCIQKFLEKL